MDNDKTNPEVRYSNYVLEVERLRELAANLQSRGSDSLSCSLEASDLALLATYVGPGFSIKDETLTFDSMGTRNQFIAEHHFSELNRKGEKNDEAWLKKAIEIWRNEISSDDKVSGRFIALWHRDRDVLRASAKVINNDSLGVFEVLNVVGPALIYFEKLSLESIFTLCNAQHNKTKNDLAGGWFFNYIESRLLQEPELCSSILDRLRSDITDTTTRLYSAASFAWSRIDSNVITERTLQDAIDGNPLLASNALWMLGQLIALQRVSPSRSQDASEVIQNSAKSDIEAVRQAAIYAMASASLYIDVLADNLTELAERGDKKALSALSELLFREHELVKSHKYHQRWIMSLAQLPIEAKGALDNFDFVLSSLMKDGCYDLVLSCIEQWIVCQSSDSSVDKSFFDILISTGQKIIQNNDLLARIVTEWLLSENHRLVSAIADILSALSVHNIDEVKFSRPIVDELDHQELIFLIRHMLGVVIRDGHLLSLTLSLLDTKDAEARTLKLVEEILSNEVGIDYPDLTIERLEAFRAEQKDEKIRELCNTVMSSIKVYLRTLNELPRIEELRPSPRLVEDFIKNRAKMMERQKEKAQESSIIRHIASVITLKAGRSSFSFRDDKYSETSPLHSFSTSVTLPRRHVMDCVGYELSRLLFRTAKRDDE